MINAAIVGLGGWGQTLVTSVQGKSDRIRFIAEPGWRRRHQAVMLAPVFKEGNG